LERGADASENKFLIQRYEDQRQEVAERAIPGPLVL
jgi:hypothetical protein